MGKNYILLLFIAISSSLQGRALSLQEAKKRNPEVEQLVKKEGR